MSYEETRAATGGATRVDANVAPGLWPTREEWARHHQTPYADDVDKVGEMVSANVADYATPGEIARAADELGCYWRRLGREVRLANREALAVWPLHGHRGRRRGTILAIMHERDRLSDDARAVVEHAEALCAHRKLVNDATGQLHDGQLRRWTTDQAERWMARDTCPTWKAILDRWRTARDEAGTAYVEATRQRPVDDSAWRGELLRRIEIETARLNGHIRRPR